MSGAGTSDARETLIIDAFVDLADTLVDDFDAVEFFHRLLEHALPLLGADAGGILLEGAQGLRVVASSSEDMATLELFELQHREGPCYEAYQTGETVLADDLEALVDRWPRFTPKALEFGWRSGHAVPLRIRKEQIGALNLFSTATRTLRERDAKLIRGLADVATIAVLQERTVAEARLTTGQLQRALDSRVVIEQAKGRIAEGAGLSMGESFERLRSHARSRSRRLSDVARDVVNGELPVDRFLS